MDVTPYRQAKGEPSVLISRVGRIIERMNDNEVSVLLGSHRQN